MKPIILFVFFLCINLSISIAQDSVNLNTDTSTVVIHSDPRLALIINKPNTTPKATRGKAKGYRVQIYNGNIRSEASRIKLQFMQKYPGIRSYLNFNNPQYRVRIGDFPTRSQAQEMFVKLSSEFQTCMIVPDIINIAPPKNNRNEGSETDN